MGFAAKAPFNIFLILFVGISALFVTGLQLPERTTQDVLEPSLTLSQEAFELVLHQLNDLAAELNAQKIITKAHESKFQLLEDEVRDLRRDNDDLKSEKATLEERVEYLEAISRVNVPRTCQDLKNLGVTKSGQYLVDPDGAGLGDPAITVECNMSSGSTSILHDTMDVTDVDHCPDPGCHSSQIKYNASDKQIKALVDLSESCSQHIQYECFSTALIVVEDNQAWWVDVNGKVNYYWDGNHSSTEHVCACDSDNSCVTSTVTCNCDSSAPQWLVDEGTLTNQAALPVTELRFGGLVFDGQAAKFQLGAFQCMGKKEFLSTESCESLQKSGQTNSGYFVVDGEDGINFDLVKCDMKKEPGESGFQVETKVKLAEFPVAFDIYRSSSSFSTTSSVIPFETVLLNEGGGIASASEGVFRAPVAGVYEFIFSFEELRGAPKCTMYIRKNARSIATVNSAFSLTSGWSSSTSGDSVIVALNKGDTVDVFLVEGGISSHSDAHFIGHLIFPL